MEPVHGRRNKPEDFKEVNKVLFPNGTDTLDIYMNGQQTGRVFLMMDMNGMAHAAGACMIRL